MVTYVMTVFQFVKTTDPRKIVLMTGFWYGDYLKKKSMIISDLRIGSGNDLFRYDFMQITYLVPI